MCKLIRKWWRRSAPADVHKFCGERHPAGRCMVDLAAMTRRQNTMWFAKTPGTCPCCGHEWGEGELVGLVQQAYAVLADGSVVRRPASIIVDGLCAERQLVEGDFSLTWAREAGVLR